MCLVDIAVFTSSVCRIWCASRYPLSSHHYHRHLLRFQDRSYLLASGSETSGDDITYIHYLLRKDLVVLPTVPVFEVSSLSRFWSSTAVPLLTLA